MDSGRKASIAIVVGTIGTLVGIVALAMRTQQDCSQAAIAGAQGCQSGSGSHGGGSHGGGFSGGQFSSISRGGFGATGEAHGSGHGGGAGE